MPIYPIGGAVCLCPPEEIGRLCAAAPPESPPRPAAPDAPRAARITQDLLVFSRMAPMVSTPINVCDILNWSWSLYGQKARELGIRRVATDRESAR